jgi:hypothetical protein
MQIYIHLCYKSNFSKQATAVKIEGESEDGKGVNSSKIRQILGEMCAVERTS